MKWKILTILFAFMLILAACGGNGNNAAPTDVDTGALLETAAALTVEAGIQGSQVAATPALSETPIPTMQLTATPDTSQPVTVLSPSMNLRTGPGTLFDIVGTLSEGTMAFALGMTPAGDWINVSVPTATGTNWTGWLAAAYLDTTKIETALPIITWPTENTLEGYVSDNFATPISGIRVAAVGQTEQGEVRAEAVSALNGNFFIYLPPGITGIFEVEIVAVNCTSNIADVQEDGSCDTNDHFPVNWRETTSIPQTTPVILSYEAAAAYLDGKVVYQDGEGASQILIRATRVSDKASSEKVTPVGGEFSLPLGIGIWEVVAVRFQSDGTPLVGETRVYEVTETGQVFEPLIIPYGELVLQEED